MVKVVILVCDLYVMTLAACNVTNAVAVYEAPPAMTDSIVNDYITPRDTSYRERVKILRK